MSARQIKSVVSEIDKNIESLNEQMKARISQLVSVDPECNEINGAIKALAMSKNALVPPKKDSSPDKE